MNEDSRPDMIEFDDTVTLALATLVCGSTEPRPDVRSRLLARLAESSDAPAGFSFRFASEGDWLPHPVPGIRMKMLAWNRPQGYAMLLLDVAPGTRFPAHHHSSPEDCYVLSGSLYTCGQRMSAGDFLHADAHTDHSELRTDEGCRVLLVVSPDDYLPKPPR